MIPGKKVSIDGRALIAAPLNFKAIREFGPAVAAVSAQGGIKAADVDVIVGVLGASLRRNHPEITDDYLMEHVDTRNAGDLLASVMGASAGDDVLVDEDAASGELKPIS